MYLPLYLACFAFPFGVAVQYSLTVLLLLYLLVESQRTSRPKESLLTLWHSYKIPFCTSLFFLLWGIIARLWNPTLPPHIPSETWGYLSWILFPLIYRKRYGALSNTQWKRVETFLVVLCAGWALMVLSQYLWPWRLVGIHITPDDGRPKGFYSHPLSLAYAVALLWPFSVQRCLCEPKKALHWVLFFSVGTILVLTRSRTVQIFSLALLLWNVFFLFRGKRRFWLLGILLLTIGGIYSTNNIVSHNLRRMLAGQSPDHKSGYPDDRMAFWHVHFNMWKEYPLRGHGLGLSEEYRKPYYVDIGLQNFARPYAAHNLFLQVLVNEGLIGFFGFLLWLGWYLHVCRFRIPSVRFRSIASQTWWLFLLAGLTQNSFQDSSVRMGLTLFCTAIWLSLREEPHPHPS